MTHDEETVDRVAMAIWDDVRDLEDRCDMEWDDMPRDHVHFVAARAALSAMPPQEVSVQEAAKVLLGSDFSSPIIEALDPYRNDVEIHEDVRTALRALAEGRVMVDLKIRNATKDQFPVVADMARENVDTIERRGFRDGIVICRGGLYVYLYMTDSGKTVVAYVNQHEGEQ